jgi:hypothetical protein
MKDYLPKEIRKLLKNQGKFVYPKNEKFDNTVETEFRLNRLISPEVRYEGEWDKKKNIKHGKGVQVWEDGTYFEGTFKHDKANGYGRIILSD